MSILSIFCAVLVLASVVALASYLYGRKVGAADASKAAKAVAEMAARHAMYDSWAAAVKRAELEDMGNKRAEVRLGLRAVSGTRLGLGAFRN